MKLLVVNWQDRDNPQAGGAEIHLHEIFGRVAARGHEIALMCGGWRGCAPRAVLDGIDVYRVGTRNTFQFLAWPHYRRHFADARFDVLVEDINKIPLFTPLWRPRRALALVPHLFGSTAFREVAAPMAAMVWAAERPLPLVYGRVPFEAISQSTAADLAERGIPRDHVRVIYPGVDADRYTPAPDKRAPNPLFAYVGRLKRYKGVDIVLRSFAALEAPDATLEIAGSGDYRAELERLAASLDLGARVRFLGFISEDEKLSLLRRAWALAFASPKEGWGMTNPEAAACGTPVIASDSPGLRETVIDGETGFLVPHGDIAAMTAAMARIAGAPALVETLGANAREFARRFSWETAARQTEAHLMEITEGSAARPGEH
ncbi:MAG: glycosyltransferase family 4 protein [Gemmatimonadota bacterium]|nr:glycosyltransferase family 4 protein [Gemmatimonadota bacterium]